MNISGLAGGYDAVLGRVFSGALRNAGNVFTPRRIVRFMVEAVDVTAADRLIDPACGTGGFLVWSWRRVIEQLNDNSELTEEQRQNIAQQFADAMFACDERQEAVDLAKANLALHGIIPTAGFRSHIRRHDGLYREVIRTGVDDGRFEGAEERAFSVIAMNPPFGSIGNAEQDRRILDLFELGTGASTPVEYLFVERAIRLLDAGGRLAVIMPEGFLSRTSGAAQDARNYLFQHIRLVAVVTVPREAWRVANTRFETNASIVFGVRKRRDFEQTAPALLTAVEHVDVTDPRAADDLEDLLPAIRAGFYAPA